jgi:hypothetical protein
MSLPFFGLQFALYSSVCDFKIVAALIMKIAVVWDVKSCSLKECYRRLGGMNCRHIQGRKWRQYVIPNRQ